MLLQVNDVEKYYNNKNNVTRALNKLSFQVEEGEFVSIMGASGSGKTTILNCISTLDSVNAGGIFLNSVDITELSEENVSSFRRDNLGFIFQDFNLLETLTIEENIVLPLTIKGVSLEEINEQMKDVILSLDIGDIASKFPNEVSGGQKQRCAIARAVISNPKIILADEPTGALDSRTAKTIMELLDSLNKNEKKTILLVTHDPLSACYANRILFMKDGKIFNEISKGGKANNVFYNEILDALSALGRQ